MMSAHLSNSVSLLTSDIGSKGSMGQCSVSPSPEEFFILSAVNQLSCNK